MATCIYCDTDEKDFDPRDRFTDEHVIPKAVGGNIIQRNPFLLPKAQKMVCSWCNNICGRYVDGPFARSWLTQIQRAGSVWKYIDLTHNPSVPLACLGTMDINLKDLRAPDGRQCDGWLGPTGDPIYHFHRPYPAEPYQSPTVGRPRHLHLDKVDPGYVFLFLRAKNPAWHATIFNSVADEFEGADLYLANGHMGDSQPPRFSDLSLSLERSDFL